MAARKSVLYLDKILPVTYDINDLIVNKLETGKFMFTITGIVKVIGIIISTGAYALFFGSNTCAQENDDELYKYLFAAIVAGHIANVLLLYIVFVSGRTVSNPGLWVHLDIFSNLILSFAAIAAGILTAMNCSTTSVRQVPGPLAIAGGVVIIGSCFSMFLLYRYREYNDALPNGAPQRRRTLMNRLSVLV